MSHGVYCCVKSTELSTIGEHKAHEPWCCFYCWLMSHGDYCCVKSTSRVFFSAILKVNDESISIISSGQSTGLDLNGATMFFGGIPRELVLDKFKGL